MKIVYCIDQLESIGGTERVTIVKANALAEVSGLEVYIVVAYSRKANASLPLNSKVRVVDLDVRYYDDRSSNRISSLLFYRRKTKEHKKKLELALNGIMPDIVISIGASEKRFLTQIRINSNPALIREMHFHKYYRRMLATGFWEKCLARIGEFTDYCISINRYDKIIVLTEEDKNDNWKGNPKVLVMPNPITEVPRRQSTLDNKVVIAAGRLTKEKNFGSLISAWAEVHRNCPDWQLKIFGDGPKRQELQRQIDALGLAESAVLCGFTNDIFEEMAEASVYAMSSLLEGFGLVLVEAMGCGLPLVSYDCPCGPKDLIQDGTNGFLVPFGDEKMLARRLMTVMGDKQLRQRMGHAAYEASKAYSMDALVKRWMSLFQDLLAHKAR